jgi:hypothetical protein
MGQFVVSHDKHRVCNFLSHFCILLCHPPEILAKCSLLLFVCGWIIHQFLVAGYCFTRDGMHHGTGKMFEHQRDALLHVLHEAPWYESIVSCNFFLDGEYVNCLSGHHSMMCSAWNCHECCGLGYCLPPWQSPSHTLRFFSPPYVCFSPPLWMDACGWCYDGDLCDCRDRARSIISRYSLM